MERIHALSAILSKVPEQSLANLLQGHPGRARATVLDTLELTPNNLVTLLRRLPENAPLRPVLSHLLQAAANPLIDKNTPPTPAVLVKLAANAGQNMLSWALSPLPVKAGEQLILARASSGQALRILSSISAEQAPKPGTAPPAGSISDKPAERPPLNSSQIQQLAATLRQSIPVQTPEHPLLTKALPESNKPLPPEVITRVQQHLPELIPKLQQALQMKQQWVHSLPQSTQQVLPALPNMIERSGSLLEARPTHFLKGEAGPDAKLLVLAVHHIVQILQQPQAQHALPSQDLRAILALFIPVHSAKVASSNPPDEALDALFRRAEQLIQGSLARFSTLQLSSLLPQTQADPPINVLQCDVFVRFGDHVSPVQLRIEERKAKKDNKENTRKRSWKFSLNWRFANETEYSATLHCDEQEHMQIQLWASNAEVRAQMRDQLPELHKELHDAGVTLTSVRCEEQAPHAETLPENQHLIDTRA